MTEEQLTRMGSLKANVSLLIRHNQDLISENDKLKNVNIFYGDVILSLRKQLKEKEESLKGLQNLANAQSKRINQIKNKRKRGL